jgi:hypothetical protein
MGMDIGQGEEIIGVYGNKNSSNCFSNIGFIVWQPP